MKLSKALEARKNTSLTQRAKPSMPSLQQPRTRKLTIVAQDPSVRINNRFLRTQIDVPAEEIGVGPRGYRVHLVDYDSSTTTLYKPIKYPRLNGESDSDP